MEKMIVCVFCLEGTMRGWLVRWLVDIKELGDEGRCEVVLVGHWRCVAEVREQMKELVLKVRVLVQGSVVELLILALIFQPRQTAIQRN